MTTRTSLVERFPPPDRPWTEHYVDVHRRFVSAVLDDGDLVELFATGERLPPGFGVGLDERVVEFPWLFAHTLRGSVLDAGSALNHAHIVERVLPRVDRLHIVTLAPEEVSFVDRGISYVFADLRDLPYRDGTFDTVVSLSTLEHVGMDNTVYGVRAPRAEDPGYETGRALAELRRVLRPDGRLLVTVPYGAPEDHGWFRQFGRSDVERLLADADPADVALTVYRYAHDGWQISGLDEAAGATYRDFTADPTPVSDLAAAARAVVCVALGTRR
jgi:SAM-dependent methyltransferase